LKEDLEDELTNILNYLSENKSRPLDETLKVLYRVVRWRLSMNDCACRGYIFDNYPRFEEEIKHIFIPLAPSKLKRKIKRKPKVQIVVPV
jgi:adenylate kinase